MPFFVNTPESLLDRADSRNPSTTCRGITASGRPCRRPVASPEVVTPPVARWKTARLRADDPRDAALYCWQHKEQANMSTHSSPGPRMSSTPILEERTSLDTLADRLGLVSLPAKLDKPKRRRHPQQEPQQQRQHQNQQQLADKHGRLHSGKQQQKQRPTKFARPKPAKTVEFCCCFRIPIEEVPPPSRPKPRPLQSPASASLPPGISRQEPSTDGHQRSSASATARYMSLIPENTSPQTASLLMSELAKPPSRLDEPGYIYMFWLTPESQPAQPPVAAARALLTPPPPTIRTRPAGQRRPSDVFAAFVADDSISARANVVTGGAPGRAVSSETTVLLKIGRATNVQRRLNEWTRQCGYNLSLIRYYPYIPSAGPAAVPRKLPHSHKVERLIHIELAGLGLRVTDREKCLACGREHREWFEVDATRKGVADVDKIIRRWVDWDESGG